MTVKLAVPLPGGSRAEPKEEWMRQAELALAEHDRRRKERAAREAGAAVVGLDTLVVENFETNGLTFNTLRKWIRQGRLPAQKVGRTVKVARKDFAPLLAEWNRTR